MSFEKIFEGIGESFDKSMENIKRAAAKEINSLKENMAKNSDEMMKRLIKIAERTQKKSKISKNGLSSFEEAVGNFAVSIAHVLEEVYRGTVEKVMATKTELKTKHGVIGSGLHLSLIPKKRASLCKAYLIQAEKKIPKSVKNKRSILKSVAESSSNNGLELYTYCTYKELAKSKGDFTKQKETIKKYLLTKKEQRCLKDENER